MTKNRFVYIVSEESYKRKTFGLRMKETLGELFIFRHLLNLNKIKIESTVLETRTMVVSFSVLIFGRDQRQDICNHRDEEFDKHISY